MTFSVDFKFITLASLIYEKYDVCAPINMHCLGAHSRALANLHTSVVLFVAFLTIRH
jgi:hypothetical protein